MEVSYQELRQKEVINLCDGKRLGKVCDVVFTYPEGRVQGLVVPGGRGFRIGRADTFIDLRNVTKIGVDVILVDIHTAPKPEKKRGKDYCPSPEPPPRPLADRRDYGEYE